MAVFFFFLLAHKLLPVKCLRSANCSETSCWLHSMLIESVRTERNYKNVNQTFKWKYWWLKLDAWLRHILSITTINSFIFGLAFKILGFHQLTIMYRQNSHQFRSSEICARYQHYNNGLLFIMTSWLSTYHSLARDVPWKFKFGKHLHTLFRSV